VIPITKRPERAGARTQQRRRSSVFGRGVAPWRDLSDEFGKWYIIYTRFWRWAKKGVWEQIFKHLSEDSDFEYVLVDATLVRAHQHGTGAKGRRQNQAIGKSRGGLTTKIAVIVDALGNLIRFMLLPRQRHDIISFHALIAGIHCLALIGDKGFDAGGLRERLRAKDMEAVIPLWEGTSGYAEHDPEENKWRHLVENFFCCMKAFRRIATRYEKTDKCFASMVNLVATVLWTR
jgi:transposase